MATTEKDQLLFDELRRIAEENGGKLISTQWLGSKEKHRFAFADGRQFEMQPNNLSRNGWPKDPDVYFNRTGPVQTSILDYNERMLSPLRTLAESNGGKLISKEWLGANSPLRFAFADEREFEMQPAHLKTSGWPQDPETYIRRSNDRATTHLGEVRQIAETNGGKLISTEWLGALTPHRFSFADGREFHIRPSNLKSQGWPKDPDRYFALAGTPEVHMRRLQDLAQAHGGKLISTEWGGTHANHRFAFADGREFDIQPSTLRSHGWPKDADAYLKMRSSIAPSGGTESGQSTSPQSLGERVKQFKESRPADAGGKTHPRRTV